MPPVKFIQKAVSKYLLALVLLLALGIQSCSGDQPPLISFNPASPSPTSEAVKIGPLATVTFEVEVPHNTPPGQPVMLSLLDEVTGLGLNISRNEMQQIAEYTYSITLPFPLGASIKYRYARQASYIAEEHTTDQRPVRYRIYRVDGPGLVRDLVAAWSDSQYTGSTGRIAGRVTSAQEGEPIPNLLVTAGGMHSITSSTGDYIIEGLSPGLHNLVLYAFDGGYPTYQQGALVAAQSTTPADIQLSAAHLVKIIFSVTVPDGTLPGVPLRLAGNLTQLGNTFADLSGGVNTLASRMPALAPLPDGRYALEMELPSGAYLEYKYTLGDGFWNSEYTNAGKFRLRTLTVPDQDTVIHDTIDSWGENFNAGPILFDLTVPPSTPEFDIISIQFSPYAWTEPIPMWKLGDDHWAYMLNSPLTGGDDFVYRYCRNDQCGRADDELTPGNISQGRVVTISEGKRTINVTDIVEAWHWLGTGEAQQSGIPYQVNPRPQDFIAGIELQTYYHPSLTPRLPVTFREIETMGANWVYLSPTWSYTHQNPPILEPVPGRDQSWSDLTQAAGVAQSFGLQVAYHPYANFSMDLQEWWLSSTRDFPWWQVWFERYSSFILSFADQARLDGARGLVLGGPWVAPALPGGILPDGSPSGVPLDAEQRWRDLIISIRERFDGTLFWALPTGGEQIDPPPFVEDLDQVFLLWSLPLAEQDQYTQELLYNRAADYLDEEVSPLDLSLEMPITVAASYPSADGGVLGCIADAALQTQGCVDPKTLEPPYADNPGITLNLNQQTDAYAALLQAINERDWIDGFVSLGFYSPARLEDKSASIHGKPAQDLLTDWLSGIHPPG